MLDIGEQRPDYDVWKFLPIPSLAYNHDVDILAEQAECTPINITALVEEYRELGFPTGSNCQPGRERKHQIMGAFAEFVVNRHLIHVAGNPDGPIEVITPDNIHLIKSMLPREFELSIHPHLHTTSVIKTRIARNGKPVSQDYLQLDGLAVRHNNDGTAIQIAIETKCIPNAAMLNQSISDKRIHKIGMLFRSSPEF